MISKAEFRAAEAAKKREQAEKAKEAKEAKKAAKGTWLFSLQIPNIVILINPNRKSQRRKEKRQISLLTSLYVRAYWHQ